jgi:hypothetical protein
MRAVGQALETARLVLANHTCTVLRATPNQAARSVTVSPPAITARTAPSRCSATDNSRMNRSVTNQPKAEWEASTEGTKGAGAPPGGASPGTRTPNPLIKRAQT